MALDLNNPPQETQTYLAETNLLMEPILQAVGAVEKGATPEAVKALKDSVTAYETTRKGLSSKLTEAQIRAKAEKEISDKAKAEFAKKEVTVPQDSLVPLERAKALKEYAVKNGLSEEQFSNMVKYDNDFLGAQKAKADADLKAIIAGNEAALEKNPKFAGAAKAAAKVKIDALYKAKAKPELVKLINETPLAQALASNPLFQEFLLDIASSMDAKELVGGMPPGTAPPDDSAAKMFPATAAAAKAAGVKPRA